MNQPKSAIGEQSKAKFGAFPFFKAFKNKKNGMIEKGVSSSASSDTADSVSPVTILTIVTGDVPDNDNEKLFDNSCSTLNESSGNGDVSEVFVASQEFGASSPPSLPKPTPFSSRQEMRNSFRSSMTSIGSWIGDASHWVTEPGRRISSMARWANLYRFSSRRLRVTDTSHFVASSDWGMAVEKMLIRWVPQSMESFILFLFIFSFALTIPFAITKIRTGRWTGELYQQAVINWCLQKLGFEPMFEGRIAYLPYATDEENPTRPGIDSAFWMHLVFGLSWIVFGGIQILTVNKYSRRFHRRLGWVTTAIFAGHIGACMHGLWRDVVHHTTLVKALLLHDLVAASCYVFGAVYVVTRKNRDIERHQDMMIRGYLHAIEGSGTIRFTGWILWLIGNTVGGEFQLMIDTTTCQSQYVTAAATNCVVPYVFRLQTLRLLTLYFMALYLRTPEKARDKSSRLQLAEEIYSSWSFLFQSMFVIYVCFQVSEFQAVRDLLDQHTWLQLTLMTAYTSMLIYQRSSYVRQVVLLPRRNALGDSAREHLEQVQQWEQERENPTGIRGWLTKPKED